MAVCCDFSRIFHKNIQVGKKIASIGHPMRVLCLFEVQIFISTYLTLHLSKLQMTVTFSSIIIGVNYFLKLANFY